MGEWPLVQLGEATVSLDALRRPVKASDRRPGPYPYYGASGVVDHVDSFIFDGPSLLVSEDGENLRTRKTPIAFMARGRYWVNNHAHVLRAADAYDLRYLHYILQITDISGYLSGSTQPKLTANALSRIMVPSPPLEEQRRIAAVLGAFDDLIETNRRLSANCVATARSAYEQEVGGGDRVPLSQIVELISGGTPKTSEASYWGGRIPWYSVVDAPGEENPWVVTTAKTITESGLSNSPARLLKVGDTIISARGTVGKLALVGTPMTMNQSCYALRGRHGGSGVFTYFSAQDAVAALRHRATGSVFDTIVRSTFDAVSVPFPGIDAVRRIEAVANPLMFTAHALLGENADLTRSRDELLPLLMSGRVRVEDVEGMA